MPTLSDEHLTVHVPELATQLDQDEEYVTVAVAGERRQIRLHDYAEIFQVPGLYEQIYAEALSCDSPRVVVDLLGDAMTAEAERTEDLRVLDFAAGNGMVGEELHRAGARRIVGVDLLEEAKLAAERDRPEVYDAYHAVDLMDLSATEREGLSGHDFNCLVCVAALGFGDVPAEAFSEAFDLVDDGGWIAFNIRDRVLGEETGGFAGLLGNALETGVIEQRASVTYEHRVNVHGDPLEYVAIVGRKHGSLSDAA